MRIDFLGLQAFVSIAERGNFQRAAAHLNLSQTALSHRIRKLEDDLGTQLFIRTAREVTLTRPGQELLPRARQAIDDLARSLDGLRRTGQARQEQLSFGCLPTIATYHLPPVVKAFRDRHPDVPLRIHDSNATEIAALVNSGAAEFGLTIVAANSWDLEIEPLLKEPFLLVCRADHPLAQAGDVSWDRLQGIPLIRVSAQTGNRMLIDDALGSRRDSLRWLHEVQHTATAVSLVEAGVGLAIVPKLAVNLIANPHLVVLALRNPAVTRSLGLVSKRGAPLSGLAGEFRTLIRAHFHRQAGS